MLLAKIVWCSTLWSAEIPGVDFFENEIRPLLVKHCFKCHGADESKGGLRLDSPTLVLKGGHSGEAALVPGDPESSLLVEAVRHGRKE